MEFIAPMRRHSAACTCLLRRRRLQIISVLCIIFGSLCLFTGVGLVFTSFLNPPTEIAPIGPSVGAGLCGLGVIIIFTSAVCLWKWQAKLEHITRKLFHTNHSPLGTGSTDRCAFDHPTVHSFDLREHESLSHVLRKANSTVYIAPATAAQSDRLALVGVLHGTISTSEVNGSTDCKLMPDGTSGVELKDQHVDRTEKPLRLLRDHCLRRSLPRVLLHPCNKASRNCERNTSSSGFANLAKSESEGRELTGMEEIKGVRKSSQPVSHGPEGSAENETPDPGDTLAGQASLFNLSSSNPTATKPKSDQTFPGLERSASGHRFLLMNQTGQVISCTTLFDGEENEDDATRLGCRHLQTTCGGWSFFPVYVEQPNGWTDSVGSDEDETTRPTRTTRSGSEPQRSYTTLNFDGTSERCTTRRTGKRSLVHYLRKIWHYLTRGGRDASSADPSRRALDDVRSLLSGTTPPTDEPNAQPKRRSPRSFCMRAHAEKDLDCSPTNNDGQARSQSIHSRFGDEPHPGANNNASVFSLPATPLDRWSADRPLWIMGVPVPDEQWLALDQCDLILLHGRRPHHHQQQSDRAGSADSVKPTGSWSSVYAFHVRPPTRLKRRSRTRLATSRAASCAAVRVR